MLYHTAAPGPIGPGLYGAYSPELGKNKGSSEVGRAPVTLVWVDVTDSGSNFLIVNLQMVTRVEGRNSEDEQERRQGILLRRRRHQPRRPGRRSGDRSPGRLRRLPWGERELGVFDTGLLVRLLHEPSNCSAVAAVWGPDAVQLVS